MRVLTSVLYTAVLYLGLALALLAIDQLFKVNVNRNLYPDIWFVMVGVFNTWFFLSGFPADYESPAVIPDYPKGLKIFTQFVLLPVLTVYLLILYAYLFRIVFTATWPYGWVSYLVLGFSVAGILTILLVWPLREEEALLAKDKILVDGKIAGVAEQLSLKDRKEITDITRYIVEMHGYRVLQPWFRENLDNLMKNPSPHEYYNNNRSADESEALLNVMKVKPANNWISDSSENKEGEETFYVNLRSNEDRAVAVKGYDYFVRQVQAGFRNVSDTSLQIDEYSIHYRLDTAQNRLTFFPDKDPALVLDLSPVVMAAGWL